MGELGITPENAEIENEELKSEETETLEEGTEQEEELKSEIPIKLATEVPLKEKLPPWDYKKDKRWGKVWKTPEDIIQSYHQLDTTYPGVKTQLESLMKVFKENNLDASQLTNYLTEYREAVNPDRYENQMAGYVSKFLGNPLYRQEVIDYFNALEKKERQARFGANLPDEVLNTIQELTEFKESAVKEKDTRTQAEQLETAVTTIESQVKLNEEFAKKWGIVYDDKTHVALMDYCKKNRIPPNAVYNTFRDFCEEQVEKIRDQRAEERVQKRLGKGKAAGIIPGGKRPAPAPAKGESFGDAIKRVLRAPGGQG